MNRRRQNIQKHGDIPGNRVGRKGGVKVPPLHKPGGVAHVPEVQTQQNPVSVRNLPVLQTVGSKSGHSVLPLDTSLIRRLESMEDKIRDLEKRVSLLTDDVPKTEEIKVNAPDEKYLKNLLEPKYH